MMAVEERTAGVTLGQLATEDRSPVTPAEILRAGYQAAAERLKPKDIQMFGFGEPRSELHCEFEVVDDYEQLRERFRGQLKLKGLSAGKREIALGIETMLAAASTSYALIDGKRHELPKLGIDLYDHLFPVEDEMQARPQNDQQAVVLLYHSNTTVLMADATDLDQWLKRGGREALEDALGE